MASFSHGSQKAMKRTTSLKFQFVESAPDHLDGGTLYVSMKYATALHKCCCGCGHEVVTPISPIDWKLYFDGISVTLAPSIGNWSFPCRSHYWIRHNRVEWAADCSNVTIAEGREADRRAKQEYFEPKPESPEGKKSPKFRRGLWAAFKRLFGFN